MEHSSRYLIGVDLGTTNSVVAYIDTKPISGHERSAIRAFDVPQLVAFGEMQALPALPSFLYFPTENELQGGSVRLPWDDNPQSVAGVIARDHGALVPTRQVMSAKSWLSHGGVDRRASILPRGAQPPLISPVDASARYLQHLSDAWNHTFAVDGASESALFQKQEIVLTVPASFDEEARELTVDAARRAGLENFILLEEPLAAFYAWTAAHQHSMRDDLADGELVLICDIGGGTSDFSLVRAQVGGGEVQFERKAIGEHLLLGGDNLDLALARIVEQRLEGARLSMRQRHALQRACCAAKERLLSDPELHSFPVTVLGSGRAVVGHMLSSELQRDDVLELLTSGFLPITDADDLPRRSTSAGLRELGLPYAGDPAVTKHLAAFLRQAARAMSVGATDSRMVRPDTVLFNGGFCEPAITRERIVEAIAAWFPDAGPNWRPKVLRNNSMGSAVATGAAHYARVRRGFGTRIRAGSARTYYIALRSDQALKAVCVLPEGVEEGTTLPLANREFAALANRPVSFTLLSSRTRHDAHGEVASLKGEEVHRHAPLVTVLRYGKKMREQELAVKLRAIYTEMGTLELWCESTASPHRWRLQFELRSEPIADTDETERPRSASTPSAASALVSGEALASAAGLIQLVFAKAPVEGSTDIADTLANSLESTLGLKRDTWPTAVIRKIADDLTGAADGRRQSPQHEARWLNLLGFCLRPGFGAPGDDRRVAQVRKLSLSGPVFPRELQSQVQWLVLLRRICGGLNASQQHELYRKLLPMLDFGSNRKRGRTKPQVEYESWRLVASLEQLPADLRAPLGDELATRIADDTRWLWPLARLGARIPLYGPLLCVVPPERVSEWLTAALDLPTMSAETTHTIAELSRNTGDRMRDLDTETRNRTIRALRTAAADQEVIQRLQKCAPPERRDAIRLFGESLPNDLPLVSSANCLLSVAALNPEPGQAA